jgi:hypothetical protein
MKKYDLEGFGYRVSLTLQVLVMERGILFGGGLSSIVRKTCILSSWHMHVTAQLEIYYRIHSIQASISVSLNALLVLYCPKLQSGFLPTQGVMILSQQTTP